MLRSVQTPPREEEPARSIGPHCCSCLVKNLLRYEIFRRLGTNLARETNRQIISRAQHSSAGHVVHELRPQIDGEIVVPGLPPIKTKFTLDTGAGGTVIS